MLGTVISDADIENAIIGAKKTKKCNVDHDENSDVELMRNMMSIDDDDIVDVGVCMLTMVVMLMLVMSVIVVILMGRKGSALMTAFDEGVIIIITIITIIKKG